jgi:hypothetical protein
MSEKDIFTVVAMTVVVEAASVMGTDHCSSMLIFMFAISSVPFELPVMAHVLLAMPIFMFALFLISFKIMLT